VQEDTAEEEVEHDIATENKLEEEESEVGETVKEEFVDVPIEEDVPIRKIYYISYIVGNGVEENGGGSSNVEYSV